MRLIATGLVLVLTLFAAGCTDAPESTPEAGGQTTAGERPAGPPERPSAADGDDGAAAVALVEFYAAGLNYATAWGDTNEMADIESEDCTVCLEIRDGIEQAHAAEVEDELPQWEITEIDHATHDDMFEVFATFTDEDGTALKLSFDVSRKSPLTIEQIYNLAGGPVELLGDRTL